MSTNRIAMIRFTTCALALMLAQPFVIGQERTQTFDVILRGGTVIDGTGAPPFVADVAVSGAYIARVGDLARATGRVELDVTGLYVTPGFINLHSHASMAALGTAVNMLTQGVTTELMNADGGGPVDIAQQMTAASSSGLALNVGAYIGFNRAWATVVGDADRRPTVEDIVRMREIVTSNLAHGAWGVSAGLDYKPAYFATTNEVIEVVRAAAPWRTNFTNHDRVTPESRYSSRAGMMETITIGERAGLVPVITHMKVQGREQGTAAEILEQMRQATARGTYTAADAYPYLAGQTQLAALLIPGWAQDGGRQAMLARFKDPDARARIVAEAEEALTARFGGAEGVYLPAAKLELVAVMREMNVGTGEAIVRILETGSPGAILRFGAERDLVKILQHPTTSIACDCGASGEGRGTHPRNQGTYPRVLGRYVRETGALTWADAIRKMTLLPATMIGMVDRGAIAPGMAADITVFDPATVIDRATYEEPALPSEGVRHVLVNGGFALRDGTATGERHGRALLRKRDMPSRPMPAAASSLIVRGRASSDDPAGDPLELTIDLDQRAADRSASGLLRARLPGGISIDADELGVLQAMGRWASITAMARVRPSGERRAVLAIVDAADPERRDERASVRIVVDGLLEAAGTIPRADVRISLAPQR
jgi:N-acyl-D-aspartate/D-glutamate deacylase